MNKVMQTISNPGDESIPPEERGNCLQAAVASLLELSLEDVPHFLATNDWWKCYCDYFFSQGYRVVEYIANPRRLGYLGEDRFDVIQKMEGFGGYFMATVLSPKFYSLENLSVVHAVIIDKDYNIVHDPYYPIGTIYPHADRLRYNGVVGVDIIEKL